MYLAVDVKVYRCYGGAERACKTIMKLDKPVWWDKVATDTRHPRSVILTTAHVASRESSVNFLHINVHGRHIHQTGPSS